MKKPPPPDKRFKPGQSGNPGGKPKKDLDLTKSLSKILSEPHGQTKLTKLEKILRVMVNKALRGHQKSGEWIIERMFGRLKMTVDADMNINAEVRSLLTMPMDDLRDLIEQAEREKKLNQKYFDDEKTSNE